MPDGLRELIEHEDFADEIDADWLALLQSIQLRGRRLTDVRDWMGLYIYLRKLFGEG